MTDKKIFYNWKPKSLFVFLLGIYRTLIGTKFDTIL